MHTMQKLLPVECKHHKMWLLHARQKLTSLDTLVNYNKISLSRRGLMEMKADDMIFDMSTVAAR